MSAMRDGVVRFLFSGKGGLLLVVVIANLLIRMLHIGNESIYGDEAFSLFHAQQPLKDLYRQLLYDRNPPLYFFLLHFWIKAFGLEAGVVKSLSALFGTGAAVFLFLIAWKYLGRTATVVVSFLYLTSHTTLAFSHEIRSFALAVLLCTASYYTFIALLRKGGIWHVVALSLLNLALLFTHYITVFIPVAQMAAALLFLKSDRKQVGYVFMSLAITVLCYLPWVHIVMENIPKTGSFWLGTPGWNDLLYVFHKLSGNPFIFKTHVVILSLFLILVLFFPSRAYYMTKPNFDKRMLAVFLFLYLIPVLGNYFVALVTPVFRLPYLYYTVAGLFLALSYVAGTLTGSCLLKITVIGVLLIYPYRHFSLKHEPPENWKFIVEKVKEHRTDDTPVIISAWYKRIDFTYYYNRDFFRDYNNLAANLLHDGIYAMNDSTGLKSVKLHRYNRLLYVRSHHKVTDPSNSLETALNRMNFFAVDSVGRNDVYLFIYQKREADVRFDKP